MVVRLRQSKMDRHNSVENHTNPQWYIHLRQILDRNRKDPSVRFLQLATSSKNELVSNRTVTFRGFGDEGIRLQIATDCRSAKIREIRSNDMAEICWYFAVPRVQFRIRGEVAIVDAQSPRRTARTEVWESLSRRARDQFSMVRGQDNSSPPPNFCVLLFRPLEVDELDLRENPRLRRVSLRESNGSWNSKVIEA